MDVLVKRRVIPADFYDICTLSYGRVGSLRGSSTVVSLGATSLSHFHLRVRVCGGAGPSKPSEGLVVPMSVKRTRPKRKGSDEDVWEFPDTKIIGMYIHLARILFISKSCHTELSKKAWKSSVYDHYNVSLERSHETRTLTFRFTCRFDPIGHPSLIRGRLDTSQGTSNLERSRKKCIQRRGADENPTPGAPQPPGLMYSQPKHRALIAARCASSKRPFNSVADAYYIQEVEMLRPGTKLPSPATVSRDINAMYKFGAGVVCEYFSVCTLLLCTIKIVLNPHRNATVLSIL